MAEYTIKVRRFQPESGEGPYWEEFGVDLERTDDGPEISYSEVTITQWEPQERTY